MISCRTPRPFRSIRPASAASRAEVAQAAGATMERVDCELTADSVALAVARWRDPTERPDAVYAFNDEFAAILTRVLREAGFDVPGGIAVAGSGNQPVARSSTSP